MIKPLSLTAVADFIRAQTVPNVLDVQLHNDDVEFTRVNTDTRTLEAGELFVALRGDRFDAHDFIEAAAAKKPCGLVVEKYYPAIALPQLVVSDSLLALGQIAALNRHLFTGPLIAITGSSGKTTVKTLVASILGEVGETLFTKGNFNNHIGVPLTLLQIEAQHKFAVIEMGASAKGEIAYLCSLGKPQVAMINNVMPAHIEGFGSIEGVALAKSEIYSGLVAGGTAVVNSDDQFAPQWLQLLGGKKIITVALHDTAADCFARNIQYTEDAIAFDLNIRSQVIPVYVNAQGEHSVRNVLMATACAIAVGANPQQIQRGLANFSPVAGRMSRHTGAQGALVIDDSYNANPGSVRAAIDVLAQHKHGILVLGDLGELGEHAAELHAELGDYARAKNIKHLFTIGELSKYAAQRYGEGAQHFSAQAELVDQLKKLATPETTFLIKGSRSSKMDLVVRELCPVSGEQH